MNKLRRNCHLCGGYLKLCVFPQTGTWYCYRCGEWGKIDKLPGEPVRETTRDTSFEPDDFTRHFHLLGEHGIGRRYLRRRGIDPGPLAPFIGTCDNYIIFPFWKKGEWEFYVGRKMYGAGLRYKNAAVSVSPLFVPYDCDCEGESLIIVEGIFDAIRVWQVTNIPTVAILGSGLTHHLVLEIFTHSTENTTIHLLLDPDAIWKAAGCCSILSALRKTVNIPLKGKKDPGDLSDDEINGLFY